MMERGFSFSGYKLGGMPLDGEEDTPDDLETTNNWVDDSVSIGAYVYVGDSALPSDDGTYENSFSRIGGDVKVRFQNLDIRGGLMIGNDDNPDHVTGITFPAQLYPVQMERAESLLWKK